MAMACCPLDLRHGRQLHPRLLKIGKRYGPMTRKINGIRRLSYLALYAKPPPAEACALEQRFFEAFRRAQIRGIARPAREILSQRGHMAIR